MKKISVLALVGALCNDDEMAKTVIVKLTDDIDGGDADETVFFELDEMTTLLGPA